MHALPAVHEHTLAVTQHRSDVHRRRQERGRRSVQRLDLLVCDAIDSAVSITDTHAHTHTRTHAHTHTRIHAHTHARMHVHIAVTATMTDAPAHGTKMRRRPKDVTSRHRGSSVSLTTDTMDDTDCDAAHSSSRDLCMKSRGDSIRGTMWQHRSRHARHVHDQRHANTLTRTIYSTHTLHLSLSLSLSLTHTHTHTHKHTHTHTAAGTDSPPKHTNTHPGFRKSAMPPLPHTGMHRGSDRFAALPAWVCSGVTATCVCVTVTCV
jgi:hypothetical protein